MLTQKACLNPENSKRARSGSPGEEEHRPRKLSINKSIMSPGLTQSAPRRNTWSAWVKKSTTGRRKVKAMRKDLTNQRLITQLLKKKEEEEISGTDGEDE